MHLFIYREIALHIYVIIFKEKIEFESGSREEIGKKREMGGNDANVVQVHKIF